MGETMYFSSSRRRSIPISSMHPAYLGNALAKLRRDGGPAETIAAMEARLSTAATNRGEPVAGRPQIRTPNGYDGYECMSAMQKCIRRSQEADALFFAFELAEAGSFAMANNRLRVIAYEDIGAADPQAVMFACQSTHQAAEWYKANGNSAWRLAFAAAISTLCRAPKSREYNHMTGAVALRSIQGPHPEIPDHALDRHTLRGKRMKRDMRHFLDEGAKLEPAAAHDAYQDAAEQYWIGSEAEPEKFVYPPGAELMKYLHSGDELPEIVEFEQADLFETQF